MNWHHFQTYNEASTRAFEALCNQLFELWANREYKDDKKTFIVVNGAGGDGGVESYVTLVSGKEVGVQAKWFPDSIATSQFNQIKQSILTAAHVHPQLEKYIVCVPRDLSNTKNGKDGKVVKDTEYSKWEKLVSDIKSKFPEMEIILWGDHAIERQLQYAEAAGVRRYWFEKEEINKEIIQYSFDKQENGWMVQRYISVLHNRGKIHNEMNSFLGNLEECRQLQQEVENTVHIHELLEKEINVLCEYIQEKNILKEKMSELQELCKRVHMQCAELVKTKEAFQSEAVIEKPNLYITTYEKINDIEELLDENSHGDGFRHFGDVKKYLEKSKNIDLIVIYDKLQQRCNLKNMLVLGDPGTGKTHGIANVVESQLANGYHIPILIQAKSVSVQDEWKDILIRTLGISQMWGEEELWSALEALSYRVESNNALSDLNDIRIIPKVVICIDGIDEIKPYSRWNERINQVEKIISLHPRIRFCFTGRPYAFGEVLPNSKEYEKKVMLSDDGDVPVKKIYDKYIRFYNVNDTGAKWLRYAIKTPYALKLVCELYQGKSIEKIGQTDITVSNLLRAKFDRLNQEFKISAGFEENIHDQIVKTVLLKIDELFEQQEEIARTQMKNDLKQLDVSHYLGEKGIDAILNFLEKQSFLQSYEKYAKSFFEESETIYLSGTQPVYDYIKALRMFEKDEYSDDLELNNQILDNTGALQMYAVMVLERYGKLLWNNKSCREYFYEGDLFEIVAFALVNVNEKISNKYVDWLKKIMKQNAYALSLAVNKIILPLGRNGDSVLGSMLLDECLREYKKPAERDVIWSIPTGLRGNRDSIWIRYEDIDFFNEAYELEDVDCFDGLPLIWAWGLTSVDNGQRTKIRQEITKWGISCPEEFYKLFEYFININDTQAKTDFFAIAMAITYVCRKNHCFLKQISKWINKNIFQYKEIKDIQNAAIRY